MSNAALAAEWISPEQYLAMEEAAERKHEYASGHVYAMSGATNRHNDIAVNILAQLRALLRGSGCRPYNSDTKVRVRVGSETSFYYPDVMVVCRGNAPSEVFQDEPRVIFEVVSPASQRIDLEAKRLAYRHIESLAMYVVVDSASIGLTVFRRVGENWETEIIRNPAAKLDLAVIGCELPLSEVYADVEF